jgi:hypothetical protein
MSIGRRSCAIVTAGISLTNIAKAHRISRSMVSKILREARRSPGYEGFVPASLQLQENRPPKTAA